MVYNAALLFCRSVIEMIPKKGFFCKLGKVKERAK
jgi:hypothetical protein